MTKRFSQEAHFCSDSITLLDQVSAGSRIHIVGVCGVAMAPLALELQAAGFNVSGSDKEYYDPMASLLVSSEVVCSKGFDPSRISRELSLVVIGNSIRRSNVEVEVTEELMLPYSIFPALVRDLLIRDTHGVVITGTHGKSTTTALVASCLRRLQQKPSFFVGAKVADLPSSFLRDSGPYSVVEGDEYDSAFFAKVPKFQFYPAKTLVVTSLEFDHADIYNSIEEIEALFAENLRRVPADGRVLFCTSDPALKIKSDGFKEITSGEFFSYGTRADADFFVSGRQPLEGGGQEIVIQSKRFGEEKVTFPLDGPHNAENCVAAYAFLRLEGFSLEEVAGVLWAFQGVVRRQQVRFEGGGRTLIEDFAHHPTAVARTIEGLKERFGKSGLTVIFEPRSNTSRRAIFQESYAEALRGADYLVISDVPVRDGDEDIKPLDVARLAEELACTGSRVDIATDGDDALRIIKKRGVQKGAIVVMSNGSFNGLPSKLEAYLKELKE